MSRAEKFIQDSTKNCSNEIIGGGRNNGEFVQIFNPWLTPDQARKAVEIAREEIVEKVTNYLNSKLYDWVQISHFGRREYPDTIMKRDLSEENFYSFMAGIKELAKTIKPDERIVVDIYDPYGRKLNDDDGL